MECGLHAILSTVDVEAKKSAAAGRPRRWEQEILRLVLNDELAGQALTVD